MNPKRQSLWNCFTQNKTQEELTDDQKLEAAYVILDDHGYEQVQWQFYSKLNFLAALSGLGFGLTITIISSLGMAYTTNLLNLIGFLSLIFSVSASIVLLIMTGIYGFEFRSQYLQFYQTGKARSGCAPAQIHHIILAKLCRRYVIQKGSKSSYDS